MTVLADQMRTTALGIFSAYTGIEIGGLIQRGRDPETARFSLQLTDNRIVHVGTIEALSSRAQLNRVLLVAIGTFATPCKPVDWENAIGALISHATTIEETPDETLQSRVSDWLDQYARAAHNGRESAVADRQPFTEDNHLHISPEHFMKWIRREYGEAPPIAAVRTALGDLQFESVKINYTPTGTRRRTSARYAKAPADQTPEPDD